MGIKMIVILCSAVYAAVGILAYKIRGIRPNTLAGYRNRYTMADYEVWRDINERSGLALLKYGLAVALAFLGVLVRPTPGLLGAVVVASVVPLIWICVYYHRESRRQFEERHPGERPRYGTAVAEAREADSGQVPEPDRPDADA